MEKIKQLFQRDIGDIKIPWNNDKIKILLITVISSIIVHFMLYSLMISGPDTLINSIYHQADIWEVMLLRFGLFLVQAIKGNIVSPVLVTLISSIFLGITVNLVIDIFQIKNKVFKYITAIIFVVAPNISATLTFYYCSDAYLLGMLLATLSVYLMRKYENKKSIILLSSLLLALAISMYQTYLSVALVLAISTLLIDVLRDREKKQIFLNMLKYIIMLVLGMVLFYGIAHLILLITHLPASSYSGADSIGLRTILQSVKLIPEAYQSFFNYFFNDKMIPNTIWGTNIIYLIMFAVMLVSIIYILSKNRKILNILLTIFLLTILPICFGVIEIIVTKVDLHILMACSMIYIIPIFFGILEILHKETILNITKWIMLICSLIIIWIYMWQDNASYLGIKIMQNQAIATSERIVTQIEQLEGYTPETPVLLLGGLIENSYLNKNNTEIEAKKIFDRSYGFITTESTIWWGNLDSWRKMFYEYLGVNLNLISEWTDESKEIFKTYEYKNMKFYPEKDSIKMINGVVVVKLSN